MVGFKGWLKTQRGHRQCFGPTERSSHKENKSGRGDLGALILTTEDGLEFNCGTGFDDATDAKYGTTVTSTWDSSPRSNHS